MAEIILPPEEEEETPQAPELNIDKPTENSKVITIEFEAKKTAQVSTKDTNQQLYTTDTDAWFEFKETTLENANGTYSVVFRNRHDGSIFQRTGDVVNGVAYYKIPEQEIRHAGKWRGQLVYTLENGNTTAREFDYVVKGHILDGKDVREIVVEDFETLMSQLRGMKENAEVELADLVNTAERNELERQQFYESLVEDINDLQENYQELLNTGVLQTNINEKLEELEEEYAPKLTEVTTQLAQTSTELNNLPFRSAMYNKIPTSNKKVAFPTGFTWTNAPINIFKNDKGEITTDFEASNHKPDMTGLKTYYVSLTGSNSNDGLTEATPFRRVSDPLQKADCGEIIVSGGFYPRGQAWAGFSPVRNMIIRAKEGEEVIFSASDALAWSLTSGYTKVYQANRTTVNDVFDARYKNRHGDYAELKNVSSIAEVEANQGSWYTDGTIVYVHTFDSRPADSYIRAYLNTNNAIITSGNHFYIEGITFEGGNSNIRIDGSDPSMKVIMKNCKFKYTKLLNCVSAYGAEVYLQNCEASYGNQDGFNYHIRNGVPCKVIEVNCKSHRNGRDGADQNNGSTNHDGGKTIRVNGEYFENHGPNVIDVNEGSESWNLGVVSHNSTATSGISNSNFKNSNVGKGKMWLDSCIAYGSDYSVTTAGTGSETNLANNVLIGDIHNEDGTSSLNYETSYVAVSEYQDILA